MDLVASRDIQASEDLLLSYGNLDNDFLLLDYGPLHAPLPSHCHMPAWALAAALLMMGYDNDNLGETCRFSGTLESL